MLHFFYIHSVMTYGVIFWGNSPYSIKIFKIQKNIIRTITNLRNGYSCRNVFDTMKILLFYSQYIFSLLMYIVGNRHLFITNKEIHNINTRSSFKFHIQSSNLTKFQKGVYYSGIKLFNHPLSHIRHLYYDTKLFRTTCKSFFIATLLIL